MMKKLHIYGTDIHPGNNQQETIDTITRTLNWVLKSLAVEHLVEFEIEPTTRPHCDSFRLTLTEKE